MHLSKPAHIRKNVARQTLSAKFANSLANPIPEELVACTPPHLPTWDRESVCVWVCVLVCGWVNGRVGANACGWAHGGRVGG
jgi:hypothetical protein